ncbi:insulinase family protein [Kiritimatiellaeota bacterium B1221]|nr:insulinase family protein [Kiritimatiellaeota bacterium B1221]
MKKLFGFVVLSFLFCMGIYADGLSDPDWHRGELENGLRYFIRNNSKPEGRVELRLVVNAGSILEADDQQGLAHFLEHSAFNGTRNFEENELVGFLESLGIAFGADLNAYTSFDETVYKLKVPTEDSEVVEKAFLILADWAGGITNSDEALEDERGVIIEEWRGGRGAKARVRDQQYPVMFKGSRYAERLPIGIMEVLENFDFDRLRQFYADWYRPDLMSVVVVGDVEVDQAKQMIETYFSGLKGPENPPVRKSYAHPSHAETIVGTFSDPELTSADVTLMWKMPAKPVVTEADYIEDIKASLATDMLNQRLFELTQQSSASFLQGQAYQGGYTRGGDVFLLAAAVKDAEGSYLQAAQALLVEAERAKLGFTQGELDRAAARRLRQMEKSFNEKNNTESATFAAEMVRHALTGEYTPGIAKELEITRAVLAEVTLEEVQSVYQSWLGNENRVIMATGPAKDNVSHLPEDGELLGVYATVEAMSLTPYEEGLSDKALVEKVPVPGEILERTTREDLGLTTYKLSNGITVTLKPTDFKEDEVLFKAWRGGGMNVAGPGEWKDARLAAPIAEATGMGTFSAVDLQKMLSGKLVGLQAGLTMDQDVLEGFASPQDLETLLQLIHLRMTTVREDENAFAAFKDRLRESVRNRLSDPKAEFAELVNLSLSQHHPRTLPLSLKDVDALDMAASLDFFHQRFQNANGFEFLFVGKVDPEGFEDQLKTWVASLPSDDTDVEAVYLDTGFPEYEIRRDMYKGLEPVSQVQMVWTQEAFTWDYKSRHKMQSMIAALRIRLREVVREEQGGSYHVSAWTPLQHYPEPRAMVRIAFTCDPARTEDLILSIESLLESFSSELLDESYALKVREGQLSRREQDLKENSFWTYVLPFYAWHQEDPLVLLAFEDYVSEVTPESMLETASQFFATPHQAVFVLHPSKKAEESQIPTP